MVYIQTAHRERKGNQTVSNFDPLNSAGLLKQTYIYDALVPTGKLHGIRAVGTSGSANRFAQLLFSYRWCDNRMVPYLVQ
jgi:hypothetical protein